MRQQHIIPEDQKKLTEEWIKAHPTASHGEYMAEMKDTAPCSDCHYYTERRRITGRAVSRPPRPEKKNPPRERFGEKSRKILINYIKNHPEATHGDYMDDLGKKAPCSDVTYYSWRQKINGSNGTVKRSYVRSSHSLYNTVWTCPVENLDDPRAVLTDFIEKLNGMKRAHMEIVELKTPAILEVRETSR